MKTETCPACGGTGEKWSYDHWANIKCPACNGWGDKITHGGKDYVRVQGALLRGPDGKFIGQESLEGEK